MLYSTIYEKVMAGHAAIPYYLGKGKAFAPLRVQIEITGRCNLKCTFCYQGQAYKAAREELSLSEIKSIIDQIHPFSLLTFSGGEPLLRSDAYEIIEYALAKGHFCNIITNGVFLTKDIAKLMVEKKLLMINLSIDGIGETHDAARGVKGTFEKVITNLCFLNNLKKINKRKFPLIDIKTVIMKENLHQLSDIYKLCKNHNVYSFTLSLMKNSNLQFNGSLLFKNVEDEVFYKNSFQAEPDFSLESLRKELSGLESIKEKVILRYYPRFNNHRNMMEYLDKNSRNIANYARPCLEPWSGFQINAFGNAYPCLSYSVGSVREKGLKEIWNSNKFIDFRNKLKRLKVFPACYGCCYLRSKEGV